MHTALVWSAALLIGVVSALAIQIVAPMTVFGWVFCVGMFTVVLAHALYPTLTLRRGPGDLWLIFSDMDNLNPPRRRQAP